VKGGFNAALDTAELVAGAIGRAGENMAERDHVWRPRSRYPLFEKRGGIKRALVHSGRLYVKKP